MWDTDWFQSRKLEPLQKPCANTPTMQQNVSQWRSQSCCFVATGSEICNTRLPEHENNYHMLTEHCPSETWLRTYVLSGSHLHCQMFEKWVDMVLMSTEPWAKDSVALDRHTLPCHWSRHLFPPAFHHPEPKLTTCPHKKGVHMSVAHSVSVKMRQWGSLS